MIFYIGTACLLWLVAARSTLNSNGSNFSYIFGALLFWIVCAFRFETGFDWLVYENYFEAVVSSGFMSLPKSVVSMEPLYYLLNLAVSYVGGFQLLLFVVGTVNAACAAFFFYKFGVRSAFWVAFVFCWVYLPLELGTIRQSLAVSMMLIAIVFLDDDRPYGSLAMFALAIGFQFSAIIYGAVYFRNVAKFILRHTYVASAAFLAMYLVLPAGISQGVIEYLASQNIPLVSEKLALYVDYGASQKSLAGYGFITLNCILLALSRRFLDCSSDRNVVLLTFLLLLIASQALLFDFALIWNRVHYLAAFCQAALLYYLIGAMGFKLRISTYVGVSCVSLASILMFIRSDAAINYIPYQSIIYHKASLEHPSGRERAKQYYIKLYLEGRTDKN